MRRFSRFVFVFVIGRESIQLQIFVVPMEERISLLAVENEDDDIDRENGHGKQRPDEPRNEREKR